MAAPAPSELAFGVNPRTFPAHIVSMANELRLATAAFFAAELRVDAGENVNPMVAADALSLAALRNQVIDSRRTPEGGESFGRLENAHMLAQDELNARGPVRRIVDWLWADNDYGTGKRERRSYAAQDRLVTDIDATRLAEHTEANGYGIELGDIVTWMAERRIAGKLIDRLDQKTVEKYGLLPEDFPASDFTRRQRQVAIAKRLGDMAYEWRYELGARRADKKAERRMNALSDSNKDAHVPDVPGSLRVSVAAYKAADLLTLNRASR